MFRPVEWNSTLKAHTTVTLAAAVLRFPLSVNVAGYCCLQHGHSPFFHNSLGFRFRSIRLQLLFGWLNQLLLGHQKCQQAMEGHQTTIGSRIDFSKRMRTLLL
ncbi:hypothetical protein CRE_25430 [Caenorhabditis remanei]|uniref:Uncharacterized protein n=1 Tax=Caenorhabditis remanei TaxID=31234 RepID=E3LT44_CAERE|nr:hypothetical protein CRE_25430 [Caenorhabditis remanei]